LHRPWVNPQFCGDVTKIEIEDVELAGLLDPCAQPRTRSVARGIGKAWLKEIVKQLEQDRPIWEHKVQHENPLLCDGDGPIGVFRRWSRQFYTWSDEQSAAE
jgi:hypothetical protein